MMSSVINMNNTRSYAVLNFSNTFKFASGFVGFHCFKTGYSSQLCLSQKHYSCSTRLKHLAQGSTEPPLQPGKLRLYGMRLCPFDHRVHLVMGVKNIPHEKVYINLGNKPDWFLKRIPTSKVPGLVIDNQNLYESLVIADYLDEKYPEPPLYSKDPLQKAKDRIVIENFRKVTYAFYKMVWIPTLSRDDFEHFLAEYVPFERELEKRGTQFFGGNIPNMVDYMIWPWFERIDATKLVFGDEFEFPQTSFKHLAPWIAAMKRDKAVQDYFLSPEVHANYLTSYRNKSIDFDMLI